MLELMGSEYLIEHIIAEHEKAQKELAYKNYVCDVLKVIAEGWGARISHSYSDIISNPQESNMTADEIVLEVMRRGGLKGKTE